MLLLGALTLSQYLFGWNLDIDQMLAREPAGAFGTLAPGRMAPTSALDFVLVGLALLLLDLAPRCGFSRITTKARPFALVDLGQITREVLGDLEIAIEEASARVEVAELAIIEADALQMRQLLQNLIGNALKFRRALEDVEEPPLVQVSGEMLEGGLFRLSVRDNGIGFDPKYLDRIFNIFQRLHGRKEYQGSGIGLSICRKIAERHGGDITAHSAPGQGAAFVVTLPVSQPADPSISQKKEETNAIDTTKTTKLEGTPRHPAGR